MLPSFMMSLKIADLKHNMDETRMDGQVAKKKDLYDKALAILEKSEHGLESV